MRIIIACGGTGGHIFPAIGLAEVLKKSDFQILFIGTRRDIEDQIKKRGYRLETLPIRTISFRSIVKCIHSITGLIKSLLKAFRILWKIRPNAVIGFGGYITGPILLAACLMNIPTLIHEQNVVPGRANYILSKFVNKITISFKETKKYFKSNKIVFTGCPIRSEILDANKQEATKLFNFDNNKFTILVMGGSQGSHNINQIFLEAVSLFEEKNKLQIIHVCGKQDYEFVSLEYAKTGITSRVFVFFEKIGYAYKIADLIICRAGAGTIAELTSLGLVSILIPYPFVHIHQRKNAKVLADKDAAILIEEKDISSKYLKKEITDLRENIERLSMIRENAKKLGIPDASDNLAKEVLSLVKTDR